MFMLVALNSNLKIPLGHFLIDGLTGIERANLINRCLMKLHDIGFVVVSVTCDGPPCNFAMMEALCTKMTVFAITPYFSHPSNSSILINIVLDACHMLKLVRKCLAFYGVLKDMQGQTINWNYIVQLHKLQQQEALRLGNKLNSTHID